MVWTWLRSCYKFPMRVFVGGQPVVVPARWFFTLPGAREFPGVHGNESSVWLKQNEENDDWGEVTPDGFIRQLDRGQNPGYRGLCYVGERQWFTDGQLPADILVRPPPVVPDCCRVPPIAPAIQLAGEVTALALPRPHGPQASGSAGSAPGSHPAAAVGLVIGSVRLAGGVAGVYVGQVGGPIQLAGQVTALAVAPGTPSSSAAAVGPAVHATVGGPVQLGGVVTALQPQPSSISGSSGVGSHAPSGPPSTPSVPPVSSSGGAPSGCGVCPNGAAVHYSFTIANVLPGLCLDCGAGINGLWTVAYQSGCTWASPQTLIGTICGVTFHWQLIVGATTVTLSIVGPSLGVTWTAPKGSWSCLTPLTLTMQGLTLDCVGLPLTITITPV